MIIAKYRLNDLVVKDGELYRVKSIYEDPIRMKVNYTLIPISSIKEDYENIFIRDVNEAFLTFWDGKIHPKPNTEEDKK